MSDAGMTLYSDCILGVGGAVLSLHRIGPGGGTAAMYCLEVSESDERVSQLVVNLENLELICDMLNRWRDKKAASKATKKEPAFPLDKLSLETRRRVVAEMEKIPGLATDAPVPLDKLSPDLRAHLVAELEKAGYRLEEKSE